MKKRRCIKLQKEKIDRLTRKLEKQPAQSLAESEEEQRLSIQSETSDGGAHSKKGSKLKNGGSPSLMTVE